MSEFSHNSSKIYCIKVSRELIDSYYLGIIGPDANQVLIPCFHKGDMQQRFDTLTELNSLYIKGKSTLQKKALTAAAETIPPANWYELDQKEYELIQQRKMSAA